MHMRLTSLRLANFRNYPRLALDDVGDLTVLIGRNGIGKTNVLEAVNLVTSARSFRNPNISQLILHGQDRARVEAEFGDGDRLLSTVLSLEPGSKKFTVNGKPKSAAEVRGVLPAVSFIPDDLELAKKSSSVKRNAIDNLGTQLSKNYDIIHRDFEKSLRYKNRLLKEEAPQSLLDAMNETFLACATQLYCYRHALYRKIVPEVEARYEDISSSKERFGASYLSSWDYLNNGSQDFGIAGFDGGGTPDRERVRESLRTAMERFAQEERRRGKSLVGPHNDKISFYLGQRECSLFASQGQQRSVVLAWKLAEVEVVRQVTGGDPVLLLDDVMSELDEARRDMLVKCVGDAVQTFVTATDLSPFNSQLLSRAHIVELG